MVILVAIFGLLFVDQLIAIFIVVVHVVIKILELHHHLLVVTIIVSLEVQMNLLEANSILMILCAWDGYQCGNIYKLLVVNVLLYLGFIRNSVTSLLTTLK